MMNQNIESTRIRSNDIPLKDLMLNLIGLIKYLISKWKLLLIAIIIGASLGLTYSLFKKTEYVANLTFALEDQDIGGSLAGYASVASQFGINLGTTTSSIFSGDNIMLLLKSRLMVTKTLLSSITINGRKETLVEYYIQFKHLRQSWNKDSSLQNLLFPLNSKMDSLSRIQDSVMGSFYEQIIKNNLVINKADKDLDIIEVSCQSVNELFAKYLAENLVKNATDFYISLKTKQASLNVELLQGRLDSVRKAYSAALYGTANVTDQNLNPSMSIVAVPQLRSQTNVDILAAELAELTKNLEVAKLAVLQQTPLMQVIDTPILPLQKKHFGKKLGLILGGFLGLFLITTFLTIRKIINRLLSEE
jgi:hypothetical protein